MRFREVSTMMGKHLEYEEEQQKSESRARRAERLRQRAL